MRTCLLLLVLLIVRVPLPAEDRAEPVKLSKEEQGLLELTNKEREKAKLPALRANAKLFDAARGHAINMAKQMKLQHELDGKNVAERVMATGYDYRACGENIAYGQKQLPAVIQSWMTSKGHRENLLRENFTEIGLGIALGTDGRPFYVQVFATPR